MEVPKVTGIRRLTTQDVAEIWSLIERDVNKTPFKYNEFDMIFANHYTQKYFDTQDYVIGDVTIEGIVYKFIHGRPGDEPNGILYTPDLSYFTELHWSMDKGSDPQSDWYLKSVNQYEEIGDEDSDEIRIPEEWYV